VEREPPDDVIDLNVLEQNRGIDIVGRLLGRAVKVVRPR
jgi:hypothetical protein